MGGVAIGLLAGSTASMTRKGGTVHRAAGKVFLVGMFITYVIGAGVAPFLTEGQRPNFVAGVLALYLLITGVIAAKRKNCRAGPAEKVGLGVARIIVGMGVLFMVMCFIGSGVFIYFLAQEWSIAKVGNSLIVVWGFNI